MDDSVCFSLLDWSIWHSKGKEEEETEKDEITCQRRTRAVHLFHICCHRRNQHVEHFQRANGTKRKLKWSGKKTWHNATMIQENDGNYIRNCTSTQRTHLMKRVSDVRCMCIFHWCVRLVTVELLLSVLFAILCAASMSAFGASAKLSLLMFCDSVLQNVISFTAIWCRKDRENLIEPIAKSSVLIDTTILSHRFFVFKFQQSSAQPSAAGFFFFLIFFYFVSIRNT